MYVSSLFSVCGQGPQKDQSSLDYPHPVELLYGVMERSWYKSNLFAN
jgi:hypothetical protein